MPEAPQGAYGRAPARLRDAYFRGIILRPKTMKRDLGGAGCRGRDVQVWVVVSKLASWLIGVIVEFSKVTKRTVEKRWECCNNNPSKKKSTIEGVMEVGFQL
jgi:hypothetical protein